MRIQNNNLYDILDSYTGEWVTYVKTTTAFDGTTITEVNESTYIDNVTYIKLSVANGGGYAKRILSDNRVNVKWFGVVGDGVTDDYANFYAAVVASAARRFQLLIPANTTINLNSNIAVMPANASLVFEGGILSNGTLTGNKTIIRAGNYQIFTTSITLSGSFNIDYICPQHFGAIANDSTETFANNCSAELQACLDSPMNVFLPSGFYYVSSPVYITSAKTLRMAGYGFKDNANFITPSSLQIDHGRIYTDQDINVINIQSGGVYIQGVVDTSQVPTFTKAAIRYDLDYQMWGGEIDCILTGSEESLAGFGNGGKAIYFDQSAVTATGGFVVFATIKGYFQFYHTGIRIDGGDGAHSTYINSLTISPNMNGMKKFLDLDAGGISRITGVYQSRQVLFPGEEDYYCVTFSANYSYIDVFLWDLGFGADASGAVGNSKAFYLEGYGYQMGPLTQYFHEIQLVDGTYTLMTPSIQNSGGSIISKDMLNINHFVISKLDSETNALDKRHTVTIKAFKGASIDFDTQLDPTPGAETTDVTIANESQFWRNSGLPPGINFTALADLDNDFAEIEITPSSGTFEWLRFFIYIEQYQNYFKRIQVIEHYSDGTKTAYNEYPHVAPLGSKITVAFHLPLKESTKTIIRFIGALTTGIIYIHDIAATRRRAETLPYVHIDGGQRIYGDLTTSQYKLSDLNTAPSSASATGTKGDIRVTADYIYICVATDTWKRVAISTW